MIDSVDAFLHSYGEFFSNTMYQTIMSGGRVFLIGAGSSGRVGVAVDLAARWNDWNKENPDYNHKIIGVIAGGPRALIRAKEGYEDSEISGAESLSPFNICSKDLIVLISASASAKFNIETGKFAGSQEATVFYFYNSDSMTNRPKAGRLNKGMNAAFKAQAHYLTG